ncbi:MAG: hypothetical protein AB7C95_00785 [Synergistaceae bacterium]
MPTPEMLQFKGPRITPPVEGWEAEAYYEVEVAYGKTNSIHMAIFYTGFLNGEDGGPGGYNELWSPLYDKLHNIGDVYYLRVIQKLPMGECDA